MADSVDVQVQLNDLEAEEARIMRELREMDEKAHAMRNPAARAQPADPALDDPEAALRDLLLECEKEVRDAKGYIAEDGPPLRIVRLRPGESGPKTATYLSRPRNTGVDFTVPVSLKAYTDLVKSPIFLNQIRDKIRARAYSAPTDYIDDMRLLARNTATFNKGPDLEWVVQHARLLLEAAEDAVSSRRSRFSRLESALRPPAARARPGGAPSKRKRVSGAAHDTGSAPAAAGSGTGAGAGGSASDRGNVPPVGSNIEIYWPTYRKWYLAQITDRATGGDIHVRYYVDNSEQWTHLDNAKVRWRVPNSRAAAVAAASANAAPPSRTRRASEPHPAKKRKASGATPRVSGAAVAADAPGGAASASGSASALGAGAVPINVDATAPTTDDFDALKSDLSTRFDDLASSIREQLSDHIDRLEQHTHRADQLQRVLLSVTDVRTAVQSTVNDLAAKVDRLTDIVQALVGRDGKALNASAAGERERAPAQCDRERDRDRERGRARERGRERDRDREREREKEKERQKERERERERERQKESDGESEVDRARPTDVHGGKDVKDVPSKHSPRNPARGTHAKGSDDAPEENAENRGAQLSRRAEKSVVHAVDADSETRAADGEVRAVAQKRAVSPIARKRAVTVDVDVDADDGVDDDADDDADAEVTEAGTAREEGSRAAKKPIGASVDKDNDDDDDDNDVDDSDDDEGDSDADDDGDDGGLKDGDSKADADAGTKSKQPVEVDSGDKARQRDTKDGADMISDEECGVKDEKHGKDSSDSKPGAVVEVDEADGGSPMRIERTDEAKKQDEDAGSDRMDVDDMDMDAGDGVKEGKRRRDGDGAEHEGQTDGGSAGKGSDKEQDTEKGDRPKDGAEAAAKKADGGEAADKERDSDEGDSKDGAKSERMDKANACSSESDSGNGSPARRSDERTRSVERRRSCGSGGKTKVSRFAQAPDVDANSGDERSARSKIKLEIPRKRAAEL